MNHNFYKEMMCHHLVLEKSALENYSILLAHSYNSNPVVCLKLSETVQRPLASYETLVFGPLLIFSAQHC